MNNKEKHNLENIKDGSWDVLENQQYNAEDYEKLLDERYKNYQGIIQTQDLLSFRLAKKLLLTGRLIERGGVPEKEIQDYVDMYYDLSMKEVAKIEGDKDYRDKQLSENFFIDFNREINGILDRAVELYYLFGKYINSKARKELLEKSKESAEKLFNRLVEQKEFYEALRLVENYSESLPFEKGKMIAGQAIRSLLKEQPSQKKKALELANKYKVEDDDIIELLTKKE